MTTLEDLPKGWVTTSVGEVAAYQNGRAFKPSEWSAKGLPIIRIQNLNDSNASYNFSDERHEERFRVRNGDLLFAWSASLGAYIWRGREAWLNQHIFRVDHTKMIDRLFLYYALTNMTAEFYAKAHGSGMVHVTKRRFKETPIWLPPLKQQRRIVAKIEELFSELNEGVESLKTARRQLEVYRHSVLKHAFEGKLTAQWRAENKDKLETPKQLLDRIMRERKAHYEEQLKEWTVTVNTWEKGGEFGKRPQRPKKLSEPTDLLKNVTAKLPKLPDEWLWEKLGWMTCGIEYGTAGKSSTTGEVPVLRMGNIKNARLAWDDLVYTSDENEVAEYLLHDGDVLFNRTNSPELVGKSAIYKSQRPAVFAGYLIRVNHIRTVINSQYLNLFLNSYVARQHGNEVKTDGVNQSNINGTKLSNYPFPYCSIEEQREIARVLERTFSLLDETEVSITQELEKADALRQSILRRALSGQLVPQDPNDEPSTVLLDRIKAERKQMAKSGMARRRTKKKRALA